MHLFQSTPQLQVLIMIKWIQVFSQASAEEDWILNGKKKRAAFSFLNSISKRLKDGAY